MREDEETIHNCFKGPMPVLLIFQSNRNSNGCMKERKAVIAMGKRANSEGSVYQRKDGRWVASISLEDGKRKTIYCKTQREALKEVQRANHAKDQGIILPTADQTLGVFLKTWLEDTAQLNLRERTYIRYSELMKLHVIPTLGNVKLQKLSPQQLQKLYKTKLDEGYAPQTVKHIHRVLHRALNGALRWGLVGRNVCDAVDPPRVPKKEMAVLNVEQALQFLAAAKGDPLEALYALALTSGLREGELIGIQWHDLDLVGGKLQVRRTVAYVPKKGLTISEPKTAKSRRSVHLTALAIEALKRHRVRQNEVRLAAGSAWAGGDWVFCNSVGNPLNGSNLLQRSFRPLLARAGLPAIRFHDLRHSSATLLLSLGVHPKIVSEILGHSQVSLTLDTYSHVLPSLQEEAFSRLNTLLTEQPNPVAVTVAVNGDLGKKVKRTNPL
jgi:integrase